MAQSLSNFSALVLKDDSFPLLTNTTMTQVGITKNGQSISFDNLCLLPTVLASLSLPPDGITLLVDHRILLQDITNTQTTVDLRNDYFIMNDTINQNYYSFNSTTLQVDNHTNPSYIRMNADGGLMIQNDTKSGAPTNVNTFTHSSISISNSLGGGPTNTMTAGDLSITDSGLINTTQLTADYINFTTPAYTTQLTASQLSVTDPVNGYSSTISSGIGLFNDTNGGSAIQLECVTDHTQDPDPFIRFQNSTGQNNYLKFGGIYTCGQFTFILDNKDRFMKQNNPFSMTQYELRDGDNIEKYMPFIFCQNVNGIKLRPYTEYLDDNMLTGWSCIVSNYSGADLQIDTFGLSWYAHSHGNNGNPIYIKKFATCRITLVYSSIDLVYLWAVSQF